MNHYIIGVTGHRKLPEDRLPAITQLVMDFFAETKATHDNITVLSSLAEGADMLCAKLALDIGLRLVVPLPMEATEYRKDFSPSVASEFDRLLPMADEAFVVEPSEPIQARPPRGFYYRQAGIFVVKHCSVLLAVWDGTEHDTFDGAGTWETVKLARESKKAVFRYF